MPKIGLIFKSKIDRDQAKKLNSHAGNQKRWSKLFNKFLSSARMSNRYLPPLVGAAESEILLERPVVTLLGPQSEDEEHTDEVDEDIDE